jgi:type III pantothenate kinase
MLLVADVGNTGTVIGLYRSEDLVHRWRITTVHRTSDEYVLLLEGLLGAVSAHVDGAAVASVVPIATEALRPALSAVAGGHVVVVGPGIKTGLAITVDNPREVGADRIATAIGAIDRYGAPVIAVDFGTATTVDLVAPDGSYAGGAIAPGIRVGAEALVESTSALRRVELAVPKHVVGRSTVEAIQSGLLNGFAGLVDGLVERFIEAHALPADLPVVATGGLASVVAPLCRRVKTVDDELTLWGLRLIYHRNSI